MVGAELLFLLLSHIEQFTQSEFHYLSFISCTVLMQLKLLQLKMPEFNRKTGKTEIAFSVRNNPILLELMLVYLIFLLRLRCFRHLRTMSYLSLYPCLAEHLHTCRIRCRYMNAAVKFYVCVFISV